MHKKQAILILSTVPTLQPFNQSQVVIREETALDDLVQAGACNLPFTSISPSYSDDLKAQDFLRRSDEFALSKSLLTGLGDDEESRPMFENQEQEEPAQRLEEVIGMMEAQHAEEVERLQEKVKQLELKGTRADKESRRAFDRQGQIEEQLGLEEMEAQHEEEVKRLWERVKQLEQKGTGADQEGRRVSDSQEQEEEVQRLEEVVRMMEAQHAEEVERLQEKVKKLELKGTGADQEGRQVFDSPEQEQEVQRLEEVVRLMEAQHAEEVERLQEKVKQLEFEMAVDTDLQEETEKNATSTVHEVTQLKEKIKNVQYEQQLLLEENNML